MRVFGGLLSLTIIRPAFADIAEYGTYNVSFAPSVTVTRKPKLYPTCGHKPPATKLVIRYTQGAVQVNSEKWVIVEERSDALFLEKVGPSDTFRLIVTHRKRVGEATMEHVRTDGEAKCSVGWMFRGTYTR